MAEKKVIELEIKDNVSSLKSQLRQATAEVALMAEKFGATSKEAADAAKRAAELKDMISDAKDLTDAFNPDAKFNALSNSIGGVLNGFQAYEGALGLIGVESESLQKTMLKVQSAMALSQGLQGVLEAKDNFIQLGAVVKDFTVIQSLLNFVQTGSFKIQKQNIIAKEADVIATEAQAGAQVVLTGATATSVTAMKALRIALLATGIGAIVALIGFAADAMGLLSDETEDETKKQKELERQTANLDKTLQHYNDTNNEVLATLERTTREELALAKRRGASDVELSKITLESAKNRLDTLKFEEEELRKLYIKYSKTGTEEQFAKVEKEWKSASQAVKDQRITILELENDLTEKQKDASEKRRKDKEEYTKKSKEDKQKSDEEAYKLEQERLAALNKAELDSLNVIDEAKRKNKEQGLTEQEIAIAKENEAYAVKIANAEKFGQDTEALEIEHLNNINDINLAAQDKIYEQEKANAERRKKLADELKDAQINAEKQLYDAKWNFANGILDSLSTLSGKNKKVADAIFLVQKGLAIAQIIVDTQKEIAGYASNPTWTLAPDGGASIKIPAIAAAKLRAAGSIATIAATSVSRFMGGGGSPSNNTSYSTPSGGQSFTPQFNVVGSSGVNQLAQVQQQPVKAYITSGDVVSAMSLERNKLQKTSI